MCVAEHTPTDLHKSSGFTGNLFERVHDLSKCAMVVGNLYRTRLIRSYRYSFQGETIIDICYLKRRKGIKWKNRLCYFIESEDFMMVVSTFLHGDNIDCIV